MTQTDNPLDTLDPLGVGADEYLFEKRRPIKTPPVPVETQANVGWSAEGELETRNSLANPVPPKLITMQCQFNRQMQTHTVQFNSPDNSIITPATGIVAEAEVLWSVEGVTVRRVVSLSDGMAISGQAQSVTVNMYDMSALATVIPYRVACTAAPGVRGDTKQPPTLRVNGRRASDGAVFLMGVALVPGDIVTYRIPPNVGAVSSYMTVGTIGAAVPLLTNEVHIIHRTISNTTIRQYDLAGCFKYVPLFGSTFEITVTNFSAQAIVVSHVLGIEG